MKKVTATFCLILFAPLLYSQNQTINWYFGQNAGITFSTNPPTYMGGGQLNTFEGTSSMSDNSGNLLFYTDGIKVIDRNHNQMPQLGSACNYVEDYVYLTAPKCSLGLPGFLASYFCESSPKGIDDYYAQSKLFSIYPNPASTTLSIALGNEGKITVTDLLGNIIMEKISPPRKSIVDLDVSSLSRGIYFIKVGNAASKFIKE
jgi:hypothetical protein